MKLRRIRRDLGRLGIGWNIAMDDEPGTTNVRDSTFQLVYASGFTQYNYVSQGTTYRSIAERRANLASMNQLFVPPVASRATIGETE